MTFAAAIGQFAGQLLAPGDDGYDEARKIYNGLIDKRPALIARCAGTDDVVAALAAARENDLEVSVRGGGHSVAGRSLTEGGLMVDLSQLRSIEVDPERKTVRAGGGVLWRELNEATQAHGLAVTGGVISTTGIAGLTLGGGLGWLMPKYGLALDSLLSAEVVTADGRVLTASEAEHPDLFWALRGGGGNFGVVTSFEYRLYEVGPTVTGGLIAYPLAAAPELLRFFANDFTRDLPDELMAVSALVHAPDGSGAKLGAVAVCHVGSPEQAERDLAPLLSFGEPAMTQIGPMPYSAVNAMLDEAYPYGSLNYWKSGFFDEVPDEVIDGFVEAFEGCPAPLGSVIFEHFHGAVTRVPVDATACELRRPGFNLAMTTVWLDPAHTDQSVAWTRDTFARFDRFYAPFRYVNYLDQDDETDAALRAAYGVNYQRLAQIKREYDPENRFRLNLNISPA
jgi:FAD/FMN-containing dehydrogenase